MNILRQFDEKENNKDTSFENTLIDKNDKYEDLPLYSLRVKGTTHSTVHVIKDFADLESVDEVITMLANQYIENSNEKNEILDVIKDENEHKLKRRRKKK
ncbi:hypothetical protein [Macrococcus psychrotolerans]